MRKRCILCSTQLNLSNLEYLSRQQRFKSCSSYSNLDLKYFNMGRAFAITGGRFESLLARKIFKIGLVQLSRIPSRNEFSVKHLLKQSPIDCRNDSNPNRIFLSECVLQNTAKCQESPVQVNNEFVSGRISMRRAMSALQDCESCLSRPIGRMTSGAPNICRNIIGSISHKGSISAAVVIPSRRKISIKEVNDKNMSVGDDGCMLNIAQKDNIEQSCKANSCTSSLGSYSYESEGQPCGVGIDVELCKLKQTTNISALERRILNREEILHLGKIPNLTRDEEISLLFSFKESIFKSIHSSVNRRVGFKEVIVLLQNDGKSAYITGNLACGSKFQWQSEYWKMIVEDNLNIDAVKPHLSNNGFESTTTQASSIADVDNTREEGTGSRDMNARRAYWVTCVLAQRLSPTDPIIS